MAPLEQTAAFVEGRTPAEEFERLLREDEGVRAALEEAVAVPPYTNDGTALDYLLRHGLSSVAARVNAVDLLSRFLSAKGMPHEPDRSASKLHTLMLEAQPSWLDVPTDYLEPLLRDTEGLARRERRAALRTELLARFRCVKSPPRWMQSPEWPFVEGRPTLFVGQLDLGTLAHDEAQVYVFVDEATWAFRTVVQVA